MDYSVQTFSSDINSVEMVRANVMALPPSDASQAIQFFKYVSSLPYEGSDPTGAGNWVQANYNVDKASTVIDQAKFIIFAPTDHARLLVLEKL